VPKPKYGKPLPKHDPEWRLLAKCRGVDLSTFFFEDTSPNHDARRLCVTCPVRLDCLEYATEHEKDWGVWAGLTARVRLTLRRLMNRTGSSSVQELLSKHPDVMLKMYPAPKRKYRRDPNKPSPVSTNEMFTSLIEAAKIRTQSKV
jgi:WhiB family redox-sensing transcriptional regulator